MAEKKYNNVAVNLTNTSTAAITNLGNTSSLCETITQGVSDKSQRIGDKITITSIEVDFYCWAPADNTGVTPIESPKQNYNLKYILFIWKDDVPPTVDEIIDNETFVSNIEHSPMAKLNSDKKALRKVLDIKLFSAGFDRIVSGVTNARWNVPFKYSKVYDFTKLKGGLNIVNYQNNSVSGINKVYILFISNCIKDTEVNTTWNVYLNAKVNFIDM